MSLSGMIRHTNYLKNDNKSVVPEEMTNKDAQSHKRTISGIGAFLGLIALTAAFLSPQIAKAIDPPSKPLEQIVVDSASRIVDAAKAKAAGQEYTRNTPIQKRPSRFIYPIVICLGMFAAGLGITGLLRSEDRTLASGAVALGIGAAVVQFSLMILGAILILFLIFAVISFIS